MDSNTDPTVVSPFRTSNVIRSVRSSHLLSSSEIVSPSSPRVSTCSLIGSPRCDFTFIRKVALPVRTRCVSRQIISCRISASGDVANVVFPPCPAHFLMMRKTASLSHSRRASSLRVGDRNANTTPPNSGLFELVSSSSLLTRTHLPSPFSPNLQHPDPILPSLHDPSTPNVTPGRTAYATPSGKQEGWAKLQKVRATVLRYGPVPSLTRPCYP
jgi:hypothetical protein